MNIYLSPHHDDICFSIGDLAARQGGHLINIFTRSIYVASEMDLPSDPVIRIAMITEIRKKEDIRFSEESNLIRHDLFLGEPRVVGHESFALIGLPQEVELLRYRLIPYLDGILPKGSTPDDSALYCPMGIGGHRNHLSVLLTIRAAFENISRRCAIWLYEDLHYANEAAVRQNGIARTAKIFSGMEMTQSVLPLGLDAAQRKMDWVRLYASQHGIPPTSHAFTPASGLLPSMHEILYHCRSAVS